jgi:hypothetical protein
MATWHDLPPDSTHKPPATLELRWCPECGRDDRFHALRAHGYRHNTPSGRACPGTVQTLTYTPRLSHRFTGLNGDGFHYCEDCGVVEVAAREAWETCSGQHGVPGGAARP